MAVIRYDNLDESKINVIKTKVDEHSAVLNNIVTEITQPYLEPLDRYVSFIRDCLKDGTNPPTDSELEDFCMNLSTLIYFAGGACEQLGIKDDISKEIWKETYNIKRAELSSGTVADKDTIAELHAQQEQLTNICYNRAYKILRFRIESAQELLASCKKVLSRRIQELSLTQIQGG